jgi:C-terminal processing protease CtpA/Prc
VFLIAFQTGVVIVNIVPDSLAEKDKRLQVFDQIIDINTIKITAELSSELVQRAVKQVQSKVRIFGIWERQIIATFSFIAFYLFS